MHSLDIRAREPEDDTAIVALDTAAFPDLPARTVEEYRHFISIHPPDRRLERFCAVLDGRVVGYAYLTNAFWDSQDTWRAEVLVSPDRRGAGIGRAITALLADLVHEVDAARVYANARENNTAALAFAERRGFRPSGHVSRISRLDVADAHLETLAGAARRVAEDGIRIVTVAEMGLDNDAFLHALYRLTEETRVDIPRSEPFQPSTYDHWFAHYIGAPTASADWIWVAMEGDRPVGLARVICESGAGWNGFTGVARSHRGRGIAAALKRETVLWAQQSGLPALYTENESRNAPILAVNARLGYRQLPSFIEMVLDRR